MATITQDLGKVAYLSKGTYNSATQYEKNDVVTYQGSSYVSLQATQGNVPTNATYWQLIASKGDTGSTGATGNGIASISKTSTSGLVDTYTITYTNGNSTTFPVTNGEDGQDGATGNGISSIAKTSTSDNVDTYTITYTNGDTDTFEVTNANVVNVYSTSQGDTYSCNYLNDLVGDIESILETLDVGSGIE